MIDTKLIVAIVVGVWALLFMVTVSVQKERKSKATDYRVSNADKALLYLYGKKFSVDGRDLSLFETTSGEDLEKIVALPKGPHRIVGAYQSTEISALGQNINLESKKVESDAEFEKRHSYSVAMYAYSPEERREYYKGDVPRDVLSIPLTLVKGSENVEVYAIVYQENWDKKGKSFDGSSPFLAEQSRNVHKALPCFSNMAMLR